MKLIKFKKRVVAVGSAAALVGANTHAALPENVTSQLTAVQANITEVGGAIVLLAVVALGFRWLKATFF